MFISNTSTEQLFSVITLSNRQNILEYKLCHSLLPKEYHKALSTLFLESSEISRD